MFFDAFGRFALGQITKPTSFTAVLVASTGSYTITGTAIAFKGGQPSAGGAYAITGRDTGGTSALSASAGS